MQVLTKLLKFVRECKIVSKLLLHSVRLPQESEAMEFLKNFSPDLGESCFVESEMPREERSCLLSVVVPAYNVEKYIEHCLSSILKQKVSFQYEIIVVNDGSTDATAALLKKYEQETMVRIIHQSNRGLSGARNTGIANAKGDYLLFVDSDDELPEDTLESMMAIAVRENAKLVSGSYEKCLRNGKRQFVKQMKDQKVTVDVLPGYAWGKLIHHTVFRRLKFPEGYWFEDSVMAQVVHPLCMESAYSTAHISYMYYANETGITATAAGKPKAIDSLWITMRLMEDRKKFGLSFTQETYVYFLSMVKLTYHRTKRLGAEVAQNIFVVQRMLLDHYYADYQVYKDKQKYRIQQALRTNSFREYVLACECKR